MTLTIELLTSLGLNYPGNNCGIMLNSYQFRLLGLGWPPRHEWAFEVIGKTIPQDLYETLIQLRGVNDNKKRKAILKQHGISAGKLFQKRLNRSRGKRNAWLHRRRSRLKTSTTL